MEKGFEKIILQFTTDFENALLFKGGWGDKKQFQLIVLQSIALVSPVKILLVSPQENITLIPLLVIGCDRLEVGLRRPMGYWV
ncbi:hypothetical protein ACE09Y_03945 [Raphidiopsis sp. BLCC-F218]